MTTRAFRHSMPFGAELRDDGSVRFALWAPAQEAVTLVLRDAKGARDLPMERREGGWFERVVENAGGARYKYRLSGGLEVADPASRRQPEDVFGPSEAVDPRAYAWKHWGWMGREFEAAVFYELHVGTYSPSGDFDGVRRKLDHLAQIGVNAVELMPVAEFPGRHSWGYDGVLPFAPDAAYGGPDALKALIDEAHERDLMVFLDVVYNHFGPEGNFLHAYAPQFFTERHHTPWGAAINFDGPDSRPVREFFIHNALYWLEEYRFDGLRFDAVHAILDDSPTHILEELAERARATVGAERKVHLVLENGDNAARFLARDPVGRPRWHDAQWNDDFHNAAHALATGESSGYYVDFAKRPADLLGRALAEGFAFQGESFEGQSRGETSAHLPPSAFVDFLQNHDQIGNRAFGERLTTLIAPEAVEALLAVLLLSPHPPMLFMGEEWGTRRPFQFFADFDEPLASAVRDGRRAEFAKFPAFQDEAARERIPDPISPKTFEASRLDWSEIDKEPYVDRLAYVASLIALRHRVLSPRFDLFSHGGVYERFGATGIAVEWRMDDGGRLQLIANLGPDPLEPLVRPRPGVFFESQTGLHGRLDELPPWSVVWSLSRPEPEDE